MTWLEDRQIFGPAHDNLGGPPSVNRDTATTVGQLQEFDDRFSELFQVAYRVAFRMLGRREEAQDLAQEALARAYVHWNDLHDAAHVHAWVARVSANLATDEWRRTARAAARSGLLTGSNGHHDDDVSARRMDLHRALQSLSQRQREVLVLRYVADQPVQAVAETLGCSVGAVKKYGARGLGSLQVAPELGALKE
ncbi:MAG: hypothetical protein QOK43_1671 [Acidimicrobiaceae bacterium]|nr:hypothetical protein [Acidimicrobiaceae bacterium]